MGLRLLKQVLGDIDVNGRPEAREQDPRAVTLAPPIKPGVEPFANATLSSVKSA
jgi:hypothetical protein